MALNCALVGLCLMVCVAAALSRLVCRFHGEMQHQTKLVDFEKGRAEQILEELHKVQKEADEQFKQDRAYIEELQRRCGKSEEQLDLTKNRLCSEIDIRVSSQNKVHGLEEAYAGMRSLVASKDAEIAILDRRIDRWMTVYNELLKKANASIRKRDAAGRYVKKSA